MNSLRYFFFHCILSRIARNGRTKVVWQARVNKNQLWGKADCASDTNDIWCCRCISIETVAITWYTVYWLA